MSTIQKMSPATADDYAIAPAAVEVEPQVTPRPQRGQAIRKAFRGKQRRPEFYKPFHLILIVYLFLYCSRVPEKLPFLHVGLAIQPILLIGMVMTRTTKSIFKSDVGKLMFAFCIWVGICVPFSVWKGGSFTTWMTTAQALVLLFFMAAFIRSVDDCYRAMYAVALAMACIGLMSLVLGGGRVNDTRLGLGTGNDTLADANFLALYLVVGVPFLMFASSLKKGIVRVGLYLAIIPVLAGFSRTGSRMGLLALGAGLIFFLIFATWMERMVIFIGGLIFLVAAVSLLPPRIVERFTTYLQADSSVSAEAAASAQMRKQLFMRSIQLSLEHPFVGVGPGEFMDAEAQEAQAAGKKAMWHYTHNSYTELSSETGFIGVGLFLAAFWRSYRGLSPIRDRYRTRRLGRAALFLQIAILMSCIGAFFLSIAYSGLLYAILGISAAFQLAVKREYALAKAQAREAAA